MIGLMMIVVYGAQIYLIIRLSSVYRLVKYHLSKGDIQYGQLLGIAFASVLTVPAITVLNALAIIFQSGTSHWKFSLIAIKTFGPAFIAAAIILKLTNVSDETCPKTNRLLFTIFLKIVLLLWLLLHFFDMFGLYSAMNLIGHH